MDRRGFLKSIGKVGAALLVAPSVLKAFPEKQDEVGAVYDFSPTKYAIEEIREYEELAKKKDILYADIYDNSGELVAHNMPVKRTSDGSYVVFKPKGNHTVHIIDNDLLRIWGLPMEKVTRKCSSLRIWELPMEKVELI